VLSIRPAAIHDVALLRTLIRQLAEFGRELELCMIKESELAQRLAERAS